MEQQSDGIHEVLQGQGRVLVTVAGQVAEALARSRERQLRELEASDRTAAEEMRRRLVAARATAEATIAPAAVPGWADDRTAEQVAEAWQTANEWRSDPEHSWSAEGSQSDAVRRELRDWSRGQGVDFDELQADIDRVREAVLARGQRMRSEAASLDGDAAELLTLAAEDLTDAWAARDRDDGDVAAALAERDAEGHLDEAEQSYDSADRRRELADSLTAREVHPEGVAAVMLTDASTAAPVAEAVAEAAKSRLPGKAAAKRRGRGKGSDRSPER